MDRVLLAIAALLVVGCPAQIDGFGLTGESAGLSVSGSLPTFTVQTPGLTWTIGTYPVAPPFSRGDGRLRLRYVDSNAATLYDCGACDLLSDRSLDCATPAQVGGSHGLESGPLGLVVLVDGVEMADPAPRTGQVVEWRYSIAEYADPNDSDAGPVASVEWSQTIAADNTYSVTVRVTELAGGACVHRRYAGMVSAFAECAGGPWTSVTSDELIYPDQVHELALDGACAGGSNLYYSSWDATAIAYRSDSEPWSMVQAFPVDGVRELQIARYLGQGYLKIRDRKWHPSTDGFPYYDPPPSPRGETHTFSHTLSFIQE